jgi:hypothetical protein
VARVTTISFGVDIFCGKRKPRVIDVVLAARLLRQRGRKGPPPDCFRAVFQDFYGVRRPRIFSERLNVLTSPVLAHGGFVCTVSLPRMLLKLPQQPLLCIGLLTTTQARGHVTPRPRDRNPCRRTRGDAAIPPASPHGFVS